MPLTNEQYESFRIRKGDADDKAFKKSHKKAKSKALESKKGTARPWPHKHSAAYEKGERESFKQQLKEE